MTEKETYQIRVSCSNCGYVQENPVKIPKEIAWWTFVHEADLTCEFCGCKTEMNIAGIEREPKMKPGNTYTYYHEGHKVSYLIVLLSSDNVPGWETSEELWRCAQFQIFGDKTGLFGAQIIVHTASELQEMTKNIKHCID